MGITRTCELVTLDQAIFVPSRRKVFLALHRLKTIVMKKTFMIMLLGGIIATVASCKKGECTCTILGSDVTTEVEADDRDEYKDAKSNCESAGCEWSAKL
jgi:hypothetical protein